MNTVVSNLTGVKLAVRVFFVGVTFLCIGGWPEVYSSEQFDSIQQHGVKNNPPDLNFLLRTVNGTNTFHLFETIPVKMVFTTSSSEAYSIELGEGSNSVGYMYRFEAESPKAIITYDTHYRKSIICCGSLRAPLSAKPTTLQKELTEFFRFEKPGTYRIFATTQRVFRNPKAGAKSSRYVLGDGFNIPGINLTSNILELTILPDDPEWDGKRLAALLRILHNPQEKRRFRNAQNDRYGPKSGGNSHAEETPWYQALQGLSVMDTEDALRERVAIGPLAEDNWPLRIALNSTVRPAHMLKALEMEAKKPSVAIGYCFELTWIKFKVQEDCPEVFHRFPGDDDRAASNDNYVACRSEAERMLARFLESVLPTKTGAAKGITAACLESTKNGIGCPTGLPYEPAKNK